MNGLGVHRSLEPPGVLPQQARVLDVSSALEDDEIAVAVDYLNIDSASWRQLRSACNWDAQAMKTAILDIVAKRGKMENPVTGSGGMLVGTVTARGRDRRVPQEGDRIASLVSLTATPLVLDEIVQLDPASEKVAVEGRAILFGRSPYAVLPSDLDDRLALGVLDVCGAPAWMARFARPGMRVVVIGAGGKSGVLACAQAAAAVGPEGRVLALCWPEDTVAAAQDTGAEALAVDCTDPMAVARATSSSFERRLADLVFVCANVEGCEGGAILACKDDGRIVFFSMATSFTAAALTAEAVGSACEMVIGNGFVPGHAELALTLVRSHPGLMQRFAG